MFAERQKNAFRVSRFIFSAIRSRHVPLRAPQNLLLYSGKDTKLPVSMWSLRSLVISHFRKKNLPNCSLYKYIYLNIYLYRA